MNMRIGITQRVVYADKYEEARDALAHDWANFLHRALPGAVWLPVPNIESLSASWASELAIEGLIFSGGETPGTAPIRDQTERALMEYALDVNCPVLGVCRGFQFLISESGGTLLECDRSQHVGTRHKLVQLSSDSDGLNELLPDEVNSFHSTGIMAPLPTGWHPLAKDNTGLAEAARHVERQLFGIMWHPEREIEPDDGDVRIMRRIFEKGSTQKCKP